VKVAVFWCFYLGPLLTIPILMLGMVLPRGFSYTRIRAKTRCLLIVFGVGFLGVMLPTFVLPNPHYFAPMTGVVYALLLSVLQPIRRWRWRGKPTGLALVRGVPVVAVILLLVRGAAPLVPIRNNPIPQTWCSPYEQGWERPSVEARMEDVSGRQLLLVRYSPQHDPRGNWVFNGADIDGSKVVWANDMGPRQNLELISYFKGRKVWLVEPDTVPVKISDYNDVVDAPTNGSE
jgi:hypothetical protein